MINYSSFYQRFAQILVSFQLILCFYSHDIYTCLTLTPFSSSSMCSLGSMYSVLLVLVSVDSLMTSSQQHVTCYSILMLNVWNVSCQRYSLETWSHFGCAVQWAASRSSLNHMMREHTRASLCARSLCYWLKWRSDFINRGGRPWFTSNSTDTQ